MKCLGNWRCLEDFGIVLLTGESCGYMFRYLCDLTERGKRILESMLDCKLQCHENWNSGGGKHVASIMMTPGMFSSLAVFCLIDAGYEVIWIMKDHTVNGLTREEHERGHAAYAEYIDRIIISKNPPRNVHQMSGRTA